MKKILVISASGRKAGNSDLLCDQFIKGATEAGHEVEKIRLAEKKLGYCTVGYDGAAGADIPRQQHRRVQGQDGVPLPNARRWRDGARRVGLRGTHEGIDSSSTPRLQRIVDPLQRDHAQDIR